MNQELHAAIGRQLIANISAAIKRDAARRRTERVDQANAELLKAACARDRAEAVERAEVPRGEPDDDLDRYLWNTRDVPREERGDLMVWLAVIACLVTVWVLWVLGCGLAAGCRQ